MQKKSRWNKIKWNVCFVVFVAVRDQIIAHLLHLYLYFLSFLFGFDLHVSSTYVMRACMFASVCVCVCFLFISLLSVFCFRIVDTSECVGRHVTVSHTLNQVNYECCKSKWDKKKKHKQQQKIKGNTAGDETKQKWRRKMQTTI